LLLNPFYADILAIILKLKKIKTFTILY